VSKRNRTILLASVLALAGAGVSFTHAANDAPQPDASINVITAVSNPTTVPSDRNQDSKARHHRGDDAITPPPERFGPRSGEWRRSEPISDDRWAQLGAFMKQYSPKRWERMSDLSDEARNRIGHMIDRRLTQLDWLKEADPKVYDIRVKRMRIEDEIFGLGWQLTHDRPDHPEKLRAKLKSQVTALVHNKLDERRTRIHEMQARLDQERQSLKEDQASADDAVAAHMKAIEQNARWPQLGDFAGTNAPGPQHPRPDRPGAKSGPTPSVTATIKRSD
jgi:hypothetical protein